MLSLSQRRVQCRFCFLFVQRQTAAIKGMKCSTSAFSLADNVEKLSNFQCVIVPEDSLQSDLPKPAEKQIIDALTTFKQNELVRELAYEQGMSTKVFAICISKFQQYLVQSPGLPAELNYVMNEIAAGFRSPDDVFPYFLEHSKKIYPALQCFRDLQKISNLQNPANWYPLARKNPRKVIFHAGPTNSGKTYGATRAFFEAEVGIYAAPLRLLATEVYLKCKEHEVDCDLITGEDQRFVNEDRSSCGHTACTVEMVDLEKVYDVAVIDEIQLLRDEQRGYAWTKALLGLPAKELHLCGEPAAIELTRKLVSSCGDSFQVRDYDRLTPLCYDEEPVEKWDDIQKGDCVVAFSRNAIFSISRDLHKLGIKYAVIYGALPPKTKLEQARMFNDPDSDVNVLIASDAIGMGLNLSIRRIIFYSMTKVTRGETGVLVTEKVPQHLALQIAGRAGRYGSAYDIGHVTAFGQKNLDDFNKIARTQPVEVKKAGISPTFDQLEMFGYHLPGYNLKDLIEMFNLIAQLDDNFFVSPSHELKEIANLLAGVDMPLQAKFKFCIAPANVNKSPLTASVMLKYAQKFTEGKAVRVGSVKSWIKWPLTAPKNIQALDNLEKVNDSLELYCWLSYRFPSVFDDIANVSALMSEVADLIEEGLNNLKLSKTGFASIETASKIERRENRIAKLNKQIQKVSSSKLLTGEDIQERVIESEGQVKVMPLPECEIVVTSFASHNQIEDYAECKKPDIAASLSESSSDDEAMTQSWRRRTQDFSLLSANMKYGKSSQASACKNDASSGSGKSPYFKKVDQGVENSQMTTARNQDVTTEDGRLEAPVEEFLPSKYQPLSGQTFLENIKLSRRSHVHNHLCMGFVKEFLLSAENCVRCQSTDMSDAEEIKEEIVAICSSKAGTPEFLDLYLTLWDSSFLLSKIFSIFPKFNRYTHMWERTTEQCESSLVTFIGRDYFKELRTDLESDWSGVNGFQIHNEENMFRFLNLFRGLAMKLEVTGYHSTKLFMSDDSFVKSATHWRVNAQRMMLNPAILNTMKVSLDLYLVLSKLYPCSFNDYEKVKARRESLNGIEIYSNKELNNVRSVEVRKSPCVSLRSSEKGISENYTPKVYLSNYSHTGNANSTRTINRIHGTIQKDLQKNLAQLLTLITTCWKKQNYAPLNSWVDERIRKEIMSFGCRDDVQGVLVELHLINIYLWFSSKFPSLEYRLEEIGRKQQRINSALTPFVGQMYLSVFGATDETAKPSSNPKASLLFDKCLRKTAFLLQSNYSMGQNLENVLNFTFLKRHLKKELQSSLPDSGVSFETSIRDSVDFLQQLSLKCPNVFGGYKGNDWEDTNEKLLSYLSYYRSSGGRKLYSDSESEYSAQTAQKSETIGMGNRMIRWKSFAQKIFSGNDRNAEKGAKESGRKTFSTLDQLLKSGRISREEYESLRRGMSKKN